MAGGIVQFFFLSRNFIFFAVRTLPPSVCTTQSNNRHGQKLLQILKLWPFFQSASISHFHLPQNCPQIFFCRFNARERFNMCRHIRFLFPRKCLTTLQPSMTTSGMRRILKPTRSPDLFALRQMIHFLTLSIFFLSVNFVIGKKSPLVSSLERGRVFCVLCSFLGAISTECTAKQ